jgi:hypothetical protein
MRLSTALRSNSLADSTNLQRSNPYGKGAQRVANPEYKQDREKSSPQDNKTNKEEVGQHIYQKEVFKEAIDAVSQEFQKRVNPGKGDLQMTTIRKRKK